MDESIKKIKEQIEWRKDRMEKLNLSGNPEDWIRAGAQKLVIHGLTEAVQIIKSQTNT